MVAYDNAFGQSAQMRAEVSLILMCTQQMEKEDRFIFGYAR